MNYTAFMEYFNQSDIFSFKNDMKILKMEEGYAEAELDYKLIHNNFMGTPHGGALAVLADIAAGTSIISFGKCCVTLNANISYIKKAQPGKIKAVARAVNRSKHIGSTEVRIYDEENTLVCFCSYSMYITDQDAGF